MVLTILFYVYPTILFRYKLSHAFLNPMKVRNLVRECIRFLFKVLNLSLPSQTLKQKITLIYVIIYDNIDQGAHGS